MIRYLNILLFAGLFSCLGGLAQPELGGSAIAADTDKAASLRWYGHSWFILQTASGTRISIDPHAIRELGNPQLEVDASVSTHLNYDHNRADVFLNAEKVKVFQGMVLKGKKAEWNKLDETFKDVKIRSVGIYHDTVEGAKWGKMSAIILEADGLKYVHLGNLGHELTEEMVKAIGPVDVLMIPVGGVFTINGETAKKVVEQLKPRLFILPMHYGTKFNMDLQTADEFLDGQKNVRKLEDSNVLPIPLNLKVDHPSIVILGHK